MKPCFVGADLGTSGIKAGVVDADGRVLGSLYWDTELSSSGPGRMEQSPEGFYAQSLRIIRAAVEKAGIEPALIRGIALDGQMGGVIGVDREFDSVTGLDMGLDIRSEKYNALIHRERASALRSISCGSPRNAPKIMWWKREQRATYRKVAKFVTLSGFVAGKLAGLKADEAFLDYTMLAFFGNEDAREHDWSDELSQAYDLDLQKLPRVVAPWDVVGRLTGRAAAECGLPAGTPIAAGAGDQPAGLLGGGFLEPGVLCDVSGSSTLLIQCVDSFRPDLERGAIVYMPSVLKERYHALSYINGGGMALSWFLNSILGGGERGSYEELTRKAAELSPGADGLLFVPYFGGRQCPYDTEFRGGWLGLNWGHRPEHLFRSMLEGLTCDYALGLRYLRQLFPEISAQELKSYGGGSRNRLWSQIKADLLGLPVRCLESYNYAIRGCGLLAARAVGVLDDVQGSASPAEGSPAAGAAGATAAAADDELFLPRPEAGSRYAGYVEAFAACCAGPGEPLPELFARLSRWENAP
jgi:xylulokinase